MEMEDHHHHNHDHQQQQYAITDLMQLMTGPRSLHFPSIPLPTATQPTAAELFPGYHRNLIPHHHQHYEMMMFGRDIMHPSCNIHDFASTDSVAPPTATTAATTSASTPPLSGGLEVENGCCIGGDASTGRWPRQETLTLLDIRSQLHPKFKEANSKGPLWDEVSRIMSEDHGYQRSGKKCKEKFENLYKYYKKTKDGKAGRQDGKHYRFFRQLEALYGENINHFSVPETNFGTNIRLETSSINTQSQTNLQNFSLGLTNSTDFETSLTDNDGIDHNNDSIDGLMEINNGSMLEKRKNERKSRKCWKVKIKDFIDSQIRKLVEKQEEWLDKLVKTMEQKEKERVLREEEWRKQEVNRLEREHKFWAKERAWIEARDAALMEALQKVSGGEIKGSEAHEGVEIAAEKRINSENQSGDGSEILNSSVKVGDNWQEHETTRLQELRTEVETWEEVANKMACYGYERTPLMCKEKWENISSNNAKIGNKKRKENSSCFYFENNDQSSLYNQGNAYCDINDQRPQIKDGSSPSNSKVGHADPCFPFLMSEGGNLWENYGLKINKSNQNH
ncbi:PREDICTED: trihelix transcription factor PTL-like [Lupinus angustifolius]|uniref:trihelix transcription factor PTL-like n=1 Tax=Lupinus angustifolius TaxID=3871 RepID=UPI00092E3560|nr:PREDICTED: trihelix transcription factor PTL-like [Lupinus angustifolius]